MAVQGAREGGHGEGEGERDERAEVRGAEENNADGNVYGIEAATGDVRSRKACSHPR